MSKTENKKSKIIGDVIFASILFIGLGVALSFGYDYIQSLHKYSESLELSLKQKESKIRQLEITNSIYKESIENKINRDSLRKGDEDITGEIVRYANDLSDKVSELYDRINLLNDSLSHYKIYYGYNQRAFNHNFIVKHNSNGNRTYSFEPNAVSKSTYKKCEESVTSLRKDLDKANTELRKHKEAAHKYNIQFKDRSYTTKEGTRVQSFDPYAPRLDSALMLMYVYSDKLKYDTKKEEWSIGGKATLKTTIKFIQGETISGSAVIPEPIEIIIPNSIQKSDSIIKNK